MHLPSLAYIGVNRKWHNMMMSNLYQLWDIVKDANFGNKTKPKRYNI
jgi:hypothetical protein